MNNTTREYSLAQATNHILYKVFGWMMIALSLSGATAYYIAHNPIVFQKLFHNPFLLFFIFLAQLLLVIVLSAFIMKMNFITAMISFIAYALLTGLTLSSIFIVYTQQSIFTTFLVCAGMFGAMALYGYFTKADLTAIGSFSIMGLFGIIIGFIVNIFLKSGTFDYVLSLIGIVVFVLLTAYDMQKIKQIAGSLTGQGELENKIAILGALTLYLDFINLFLMLLRIMGNRRNNS